MPPYMLWRSALRAQLDVGPSPSYRRRSSVAPPRPSWSLPEAGIGGEQVGRRGAGFELPTSSYKELSLNGRLTSSRISATPGYGHHVALIVGDATGEEGAVARTVGSNGSLSPTPRGSGGCVSAQERARISTFADLRAYRPDGPSFPCASAPYLLELRPHPRRSRENPRYRPFERRSTACARTPLTPPEVLRALDVPLNP